ncbi:MAG: hypothetical protein OEV60_03425 [Actinomycetota bacterium]|nr:hypothetical protein [Actinomycetota bacterium]MDH5224849.1 hypothetical protein [Actinomycetota bacterium]MDH5312648.1 hypothetical protein [Actinomycetota bacterium]
MQTPIRTVALGVAVSMLFIACASDDTVAPAEGSPTQQGAAAEAATVQIADSELGSILVDADGMTLYLFEADTDGSSTCYDDCAATWPALTGDSPTAGEGVEEALLGTTTRDDGTTQVTYDGHPLYFFASDRAAGDTNGQGIGDVWYVVDPAGAAIEEVARRGSEY